METVNNIASAASRAIWGEGQDPNNPNTTTTTSTGQEPVSGQLGNVKAGEPYDKGNVENSSLTGSTTGATTGTTTGTSSTTAGPHDTNIANKADPRIDSDLDGSKTVGATGSTGSNPALTNTSNTLDSKTPNTHTSEISGNTPATQPIRSDHDTDKTGVTSLHQPTSATSTTKPTSSNDTTGAGPTPSVSAAPTSDTSVAHPSDIEQGSTNPKDTPSATQKNAIKDTKRDLETSTTGSSETHKSSEPHKPSEKYTEKGGTPGGMPDIIKKDLDNTSHGEGTGEKYVKSTGMGAEGGDFDASNPGAGREADRLLEEKGIHHEPAVKKAAEDSHTSKDSGDKEKVSLSEKIKDKLHIHKH